MHNRPNHPHAGTRSSRNAKPGSDSNLSALHIAEQGSIEDVDLLDEATFEAAEARLPDVDEGGSANVLAPWGKSGPPGPGVWVVDILGEDFEARTLPLGEDDEGQVVATLVRRRTPQPQDHRGGRNSLLRWAKSLGRSPRTDPPSFAVLYIHGRNDYFFHTEAARTLSEMGGAFYAVDLRKFGRSLRPWQTIGYSADLGDYDRDIEAAIALIRDDHPDLPLYIFAHSTGGLIATLWAWRNPGVLAGLILNSAWLELQTHTNMRGAIHQVAKRLAAVRPRAAIIGKSKSDTYFRSLSEGWDASGLQQPAYFQELPADPAKVGWNVRPEWKVPLSYPAPAAWLATILDGHELVEEQVHLDCPVLAMASTRSTTEEDWSEAMFNSDVVLDADLITERAADLSDSVTIARFPGKHDLLLSDPPVRADIYATIKRWLTYVSESSTETD